MIAVAGALATLALVVVLATRELGRVASSSVGGSHRPSIRGRTLSRRTELVLWVAWLALTLPRVVGLLT